MRRHRLSALLSISLLLGGCARTHHGRESDASLLPSDSGSPLADSGPPSGDAGPDAGSPQPSECRIEGWLEDELTQRIELHYDASGLLVSVDAETPVFSREVHVQAVAWDGLGRVTQTQTEANTPFGGLELRRRRMVTHASERPALIRTERLDLGEVRERRFIGDRDVALEVEDHENGRLVRVHRYEVDLIDRVAVEEVMDVDSNGERREPSLRTTVSWTAAGRLTGVRFEEGGGPCTEIEIEHDAQGYVDREIRGPCDLSAPGSVVEHRWEELPTGSLWTREDVGPAPAGLITERLWSRTEPRMRERTRRGTDREFRDPDPYTLYLGCGLTPRRPQNSESLLLHADWFRWAGVPLIDERLPHEEHARLVTEFL